MSLHRNLTWLLAAAVCSLMAVPIARAVEPDMHLEAVLVWATNGEKPAGKDLKELEPALAKKLHKSPYKWKNYFEVRRLTASVSPQTMKTVPMSSHCALEIINNGDNRVEVKLVGEGKPVSRHVESLPPGHIMVIAGDDKDDNAWLIVLRQLPGHSP